MPVVEGKEIATNRQREQEKREQEKREQEKRTGKKRTEKKRTGKSTPIGNNRTQG
jgi:hypothetical protein